MPDLTKMTIKELVRYAEVPPSMRPHSEDDILAELTRRTEVPKGHVKLDDGRVVKYAGTPVFDGSGVLLFPEAVVWPVHQIDGDEGGTVEFCVLDNSCGDLCRKDEWIPEANFVDREAALTAKGVGDGYQAN